MIVTIVPFKWNRVTIVPWSIVTKVPRAHEIETIWAASLLFGHQFSRAREGQW